VRRRFQFSLKTIFVLMLLVAAFFGGMAVQRVETERVRRQALEAQERALDSEQRAMDAMEAERAARVEAEAARARADAEAARPRAGSDGGQP
jgi:Tfp pilus assembly protein PilN